MKIEEELVLIAVDEDTSEIVKEFIEYLMTKHLEKYGTRFERVKARHLKFCDDAILKASENIDKDWGLREKKVGEVFGNKSQKHIWDDWEVVKSD